MARRGVRVRIKESSVSGALNIYYIIICSCGSGFRYRPYCIAEPRAAIEGRNIISSSCNVKLFELFPRFFDVLYSVRSASSERWVTYIGASYSYLFSLLILSFPPVLDFLSQLVNDNRDFILHHGRVDIDSAELSDKCGIEVE